MMQIRVDPACSKCAVGLDTLAEAGVDVDERPYRPHLTVGRKRHPDVAALAAYAGPVWSAVEVELVRSVVGRSVHHTVLERFPLGLLCC